MSQFFELVENETVNGQLEISHIGEVIKIIGVGGGGCNAVDNMVKSGLRNVEFICANTDAKALSRNHAHHLLQLGQSLTRGLGAGSHPEVGKKSAQEDRDKITALLKGADMLFITSGMGGGTGTGAAPVIADIARSLDILTVGIVTRPFEYEGEKRLRVAAQGIEEMRKYVDSLIVIPNEKLMTQLDEDVSMRDAFAAADEVLHDAVAGITEVIKTPGFISLDFADVRTVMSGRGISMMGSGTASGPHRASEATEKAIFSPLLDDLSLDGARGVLVNISATPGSLKLKEYNEIIGIIQNHIHPDSDFKAGMAEIEDMNEDEIRVTVIATGLNTYKPVSAADAFAESSVSSDNESVSVQHDLSNNGDAVSTSKDEPFNTFNKSVFSTPAFFRKNRS